MNTDSYANFFVPDKFVKKIAHNADAKFLRKHFGVYHFLML
jgi:hypothetical protein